MIEFGCGDGNQLSLADYRPVSRARRQRGGGGACRKRFEGDATKEFRLVDEYDGERAELALSLDVIFHLVEDAVFEEYMRLLFEAAERYVIVFERANTK